MTARHVKPPAIDELPTEPGAVIAVGQWWFVLLRPHREGFSPSWELLHLPAEFERSASMLGFETGKPYDQATIEAEIEQEGRFEIISHPISGEGRLAISEALTDSMDCKLSDHEGTIRMLRVWLDNETNAHQKTQRLVGSLEDQLMFARTHDGS